MEEQIVKRGMLMHPSSVKECGEGFSGGLGCVVENRCFVIEKGKMGVRQFESDSESQERGEFPPRCAFSFPRVFSQGPDNKTIVVRPLNRATAYAKRLFDTIISRLLATEPQPLIDSTHTHAGDRV